MWEVWKNAETVTAAFHSRGRKDDGKVQETKRGVSMQSTVQVSLTGTKSSSKALEHLTSFGVGQRL
jgi:hypothetical protein